jgi:hypothetical protein
MLGRFGDGGKGPKSRMHAGLVGADSARCPIARGSGALRSRPDHEFQHQAPARWTATRSVAGAPGDDLPRPTGCGKTDPALSGATTPKGDHVQTPCYRRGHHLGVFGSFAAAVGFVRA